MRVRFLGTAAGGGLPQWNCACAGCRAAREGGWSRRQDTVAISGDGRVWYLLNAAPDLRLDAPELHPGPGLRETPLRGVILTSAELDHTTGLLTLRETSAISVYASSTVLAATPALSLLRRYTTVNESPLIGGVPAVLDGGLTVTAFPLGDKRPRYAGESAAGIAAPSGAPAGEWVVGLRLTNGRTTVIYAPCLAEWSDELTRADVVILDGTFFSDDELRRHTGVDRTARQMGHLPIEESLPLLAPGPRYLYTHLNNTNPVARPDSPERALLHRHGAAVAPEGRDLADL
ncbi:pyrroloquinoline quinone biosynthesis protein PqqB [Paractinoplanes globisporus]|uniref:Coenzyme PQQ synthesis protein B n=1 Tax=Paractinoplanes globisporus TaxID=113565 RepID=A0ABW6WXT1_9ACTN|nr:MBL fold metallo-hydrolase [Actinoplanes globisporus]